MINLLLISLVLCAQVSFAEVRNRVYTLNDVSAADRPFQCRRLKCAEDCQGLTPCGVDNDSAMECVDTRFIQDGKKVGHCYPRFIKYYTQKEFADTVSFEVAGKTVTCDKPTFSLVAKSDDQYKPPVVPPVSVEFLPLLLCYNVRSTGAGIGGQRIENDYTAICDSLVTKLKTENPTFFTKEKFNLDNTLARGYMGVVGRKPNEILRCFKDGAWTFCKDPTLKGTALNCRLWANVPNFF